MSTQVTEFKCPACTAPLRYAQDTGRLECDYCGSSYTVEEAEAFSEEKQKQAEEAFQKEAEAAKADAGQWDAPEAQGDWGADAAHLKTYHCPSCGAELICDEATAATSCPYCGNNTIIPGQFTGALKPDLVIPFKVGREEALSTLRAHYKGKRLLPPMRTIFRRSRASMCRSGSLTDRRRRMWISWPPAAASLSPAGSASPPPGTLLCAGRGP